MKRYNMKWVESQLDKLAQLSPAPKRFPTWEAKGLLLHGANYAKDEWWFSIKAKSLGAGVYEVWAEKGFCVGKKDER